MQEAGKQTRYSERIDNEARSWVIYLHSGDATSDKLAEFESWIAADAAHARAYRDYEQLMLDVALPCGLQEEAQLTTLAPYTEKAGYLKAVSLAAAGLVTVCAIFTYFITSDIGSVDYTPVQIASKPAIETQTAEIRDIDLPDGSIVTLGAKSRIDYTFTNDLRVVTLHEGEAFFDVAADASRPFYVQASDRLVRVVGTRFDVRQTGGAVTVSVVEGVVEVMKAEDPIKTERRHRDIKKDTLTPGDKVVAIIGDDHRQIEEVDPDKAAAWRKGWLSYESVSLGDIIADIQRYDSRHFAFKDAALSDVRVTAAFGADKVDQFFDALEASHPIVVEYRDGGSVIIVSSY